MNLFRDLELNNCQSIRVEDFSRFSELPPIEVLIHSIADCFCRLNWELNPPYPPTEASLLQHFGEMSHGGTSASIVRHLLTKGKWVGELQRHGEEFWVYPFDENRLIPNANWIPGSNLPSWKYLDRAFSVDLYDNDIGIFHLYRHQWQEDQPPGDFPLTYPPIVTVAIAVCYKLNIITRCPSYVHNLIAVVDQEVIPIARGWREVLLRLLRSNSSDGFYSSGIVLEELGPLYGWLQEFAIKALRYMFGTNRASMSEQEARLSELFEGSGQYQDVLVAIASRMELRMNELLRKVGSQSEFRYVRQPIRAAHQDRHSGMYFLTAPRVSSIESGFEGWNQTCQFFSGAKELMCAVHPTGTCKNCPDYHERS